MSQVPRLTGSQAVGSRTLATEFQTAFPLAAQGCLETTKRTGKKH